MKTKSILRLELCDFNQIFKKVLWGLERKPGMHEAEVTGKIGQLVAHDAVMGSPNK